MGRESKNATLGDVERLIRMLQREWSCSKEAVWRVELPPSIIKTCNKELDGMTQYLHYLSGNDKDSDAFGTEEELPLYRTVYATKRAYVLMRVAKKLLAAMREMPDKEKLVVALDEDEYRLVVSRFWEYL